MSICQQPELKAIHTISQKLIAKLINMSIDIESTIMILESLNRECIEDFNIIHNISDLVITDNSLCINGWNIVRIIKLFIDKEISYSDWVTLNEYTVKQLLWLGTTKFDKSSSLSPDVLLNVCLIQLFIKMLHDKSKTHQIHQIINNASLFDIITCEKHFHDRKIMRFEKIET
jgi:hypothetical protein